MSVESIRSRIMWASDEFDFYCYTCNEYGDVPKEDAEFIEHSRTDIELLLAVAEASSRFRYFADQINAYIANPTAGQDAAKGAWLEGLHAAQADVDAALDALDAAP